MLQVCATRGNGSGGASGSRVGDISAGRSSSIEITHLYALARRETTARTSKSNQTTQSTKRRARRSDQNGRLAVLLHDRQQSRRPGVLGLRPAKSSHPASRGGAARARARATALPVAAAAADGARSSAAPVGTRAARAVAAALGTGAARAVAATSAASDADATQKEAAHRPHGLGRRVAAQEATHGRSVATRS